MQVDSENFIDSSNNPHLIGNRYSMRSRRRKIYDDGDFREVVKNFYALISEINKSSLFMQQNPQVANKKIQKNVPLKTKQQSNVQNKKPQQKKPISQDVKKNDLYNFKKEPIYSQVAFQTQPYFNHQQYQSFSHNYMNPFYNNLPSQLQIISRNQLNNGQLKRNSYHIAISYFIYIQSTGQEQYESRDPTMYAKKKLKETNSDVIKQLDNLVSNEKQSPLQERTNKQLNQEEQKEDIIEQTK
ncbi:unnamed protein product (macronuclear) [Paramecium tetraurelia]|uniref:Uncharacterized protein n=1 Tax=Paramecium tetraurelia TaxID=5888 RepID=A0DYJ9_PARTE|nr:uncharacterized protein GSPATT00003084001 [Paramecium tetraurelia]CAK88116.1 unnamed protein product [Paramecium tetraurelia]|eukprot:XP_001455513.1 hypothetical protein (macronuclear) [Paramecium tetraurelia strain d4-2]